MTNHHNDAPDCAGRNGAQDHGKHTPGPWSALPLNDEDDFDVMTASVLVHNGRGTFTAQALGHTSKEVVANARLIAAAPELLKELKRDLAFAREMKGLIEALKGKRWVQHTMVLTRIEMLEAAIAKAEGRS